jgi:hypothetical protein
MNINETQIESVLALPAQRRYEHFVKVVADWGEVWGLYKDGWALGATEDGIIVFPLWPAKEYAVLCANRSWAEYEPKSFSVVDLLNELLPKLKKDHMLPGIFYTPNDKGVTPDVAKVADDLRNEIAKYE